MKRRAALTALACICGGSAATRGAGAAVSSRGGVLAWGAAGCWVGTGDGVMHGLPDRLSPGVDPAPTLNGLWLAAANGMLRCWEPAAGPAWQLRCSVQLGAPVHALAASPDGRWALAAHGEQLSLLDQRGKVVKIFDGTDLERRSRGAATALFSLPQRRSFVAAWPALGESWEISLDPAAQPLFEGLVHDYRMGEAIPRPGYLGARRAPLGRPLPVFEFADARVPWIAGVQGREVVVVHLDVRRRIAALSVAGANPAGAALRPAPRGHGLGEWWLPAGNEVHVFDTARWVRVAGHTLPGPVRQLQATGDVVWALVGERDSATLFRLRGGQGESWQSLAGIGGALTAMRGEPGGPHLLALQTDPPALLRLDADGGVLRTLPLPPATSWGGVAWLPMT